MPMQLRDSQEAGRTENGSILPAVRARGEEHGAGEATCMLNRTWHSCFSRGACTGVEVGARLGELDTWLSTGADSLPGPDVP